MDMLPVPIGTARFSAYDTLPMVVVENVTVVPSTNLSQTIPNGGPLLSDPEAALMARFMLAGVPIGDAPNVPEGGADLVPGSFLWGGFVSTNSEDIAGRFSSRILPARHQRPDDKILFCLWPNEKWSDLPDRFWEIMAWFGVTHDQIMFVDKPVQVEKLWIAGQAEQGAGIGPSYHYLELLAENTMAQGLAPTAVPFAYVADAVEGGEEPVKFLGERYLIDCLRRADVRVIEPASMPLRDVLEGFAGSETLIFAESPTVTYRQLLGYYEQQIVVLPRAPEKRPGLVNLLPRGRQLTFGAVTGEEFAVVNKNGQPFHIGATMMFDQARLLALFDELGLPLRDVWDESAFLEATRADLRHWMTDQFAPNGAGERPRNPDYEKSEEALRAAIARAGLESSLDDLNAIVTDSRAPEGDASTAPAGSP